MMKTISAALLMAFLSISANAHSPTKCQSVLDVVQNDIKDKGQIGRNIGIVGFQFDKEIRRRTVEQAMDPDFLLKQIEELSFLMGNYLEADKRSILNLFQLLDCLTRER